MQALHPATPPADSSSPRRRGALAVPTPLPIPWQPKPVHSARSGVDVLPDGRLHCWIAHATLRGVTPAMLVWWFQHLEGEMLHHGVRAQRYRVWHPRDHVQVRYHARLPNGQVGPGAVLHITELLGGRADQRVDVLSEIVRLDEGGFGHRPLIHGLPLVAMDYTFAPAGCGTRYANSLTVGLAGAWARPLNALIRRFVFNTARGRAWIQHNIEEVGQFEQFLPQLYAAEAGR